MDNSYQACAKFCRECAEICNEIKEMANVTSVYTLILH
ncbi:four-helix bundle copper-binding protein [Paenibacillus ihuae]